MERFAKESGFPQTIGAIDGSHIPIRCPSTDGKSYVNRKSFHSIVLQAVSDDRLIFRDCSVGEVGSMHDARVFRRSELSRKMIDARFPRDSHLVGDAAYPIGPHLMTPYKDNGHLSPEEQLYNKTLSKARSCVERAFGLLKGRFRRLQGLETQRADLRVSIVMMGCVLHNACLLFGDIWDDDSERNDTGSSSEGEGNDDTQGVLLRQQGQLKRSYLARTLYLKS